METDYKKIIQDLIDKEDTPNPKTTLAGKIGVSESYIWMILAGKCDPGPKVRRVLDGMVGE